MSRILAIDDEPAIQRLLSAIVARGGHEAVAAVDGAAALGALGREAIDAVLLDLGLPDRDGLELIVAIRAISAAPIIVVTARSDVAEKIAALDLGADDYVTKPFDGEELLARLRTVIRRTRAQGETDETIRFGPVVMDTARHTLSVEGADVHLTPREFAVLQALVEARGRILTHSSLLETVWGKAHIADVDYLRVAIRSLRQKIEADPGAPRLIRNEPGIGYRLCD